MGNGVKSKGLPPFTSCVGAVAGSVQGTLPATAPTRCFNSIYNAKETPICQDVGDKADKLTS